MNKPQTSDAPSFRGGTNIAIKLPPVSFAATLAFYRDTLQLPQLGQFSPNHVFQFGGNHLWLDSVEGTNKAEVWLEIVATDTVAARAYFASQGIELCDEVEPLPPGFDGFWIRDPAAIVHLVCGPDTP